MSRRAIGSWHQTGSGAIIAATRLPSAPSSSSVRTLTGTIAFSSSPSVCWPRRRRWRPSAPATVASTTSFTVPPERVLDRLHVGEVRAHPGEAAVRPDRAVVGALRGGLEAGPGHGAHSHRGVARAREHPPRRAQDGAQRAARAQPAPWRARPAPRRAAVRAEGRGRGSQRSPGSGGRDGLGRSIEQHRHDVDPGDAVDERVMGLGEQGKAPALDALGQPDLPQRLVAVECL